MMVNKKDRTGGQVRDESGDPVTVRVWRQETTGRQWDMLERTLFHDTGDRPIRVCIGACPSPNARSAPPQPHPQWAPAHKPNQAHPLATPRFLET